MFHISIENHCYGFKTNLNTCSEEQAMQTLESFENKWNKQYPQIAKSWYKNWDNLMVFISYPTEIKKVIYITNECYRIC